MSEPFRKIEITSYVYIPSAHKYLYIKKYTVTPDGEILFEYYKGNNKKSCYQKIFVVTPTEVRRFYKKISSIADNADDHITFYDDSGIQVKIYYRFRHRTLDRGLTAVIKNQKLILGRIAYDFIRKHCKESLNCTL